MARYTERRFGDEVIGLTQGLLPAVVPDGGLLSSNFWFNSQSSVL